MKVAIKHSILNPLASCFVPSNIKIFEDKSEISPDLKDYKNKGVNEKTSAVIKLNSVSHSGKIGNVEELLPVPFARARSSKQHFSRLANENVNFKKDCMNITPSETPKYVFWSTADETILFRLMLLCLHRFYKLYNRSITCVLNLDIEVPKKSDAVNNEVSKKLDVVNHDALKKSQCKCDCPPMFGCIIPPDFFGNPFSLNYSCNMKRAHVCHYSETGGVKTQKCYTKGKALFEGANSNLEYYATELKEVIKDVCEIVDLAVNEEIEENSDCNEKMNFPFEENTDSSDDEIEEDSGCDEKINFTFERNSAVVSYEEIDVTCKGHKTLKVEAFLKANSSLKNVPANVEIPMDIPLVDDGCHPLLDDGIYAESEDDGVSPVLKRIIEGAFSPKTKRQRLSCDPAEMTEQVVCNPPCSVWCDSVSQSKNTCKTFNKNVFKIEDLPNRSRSLISAVSKPLFRSSFLVNERTKSENQTIEVRRCRSLTSNELPSSIQSDQSGMWGRFDGEDSLWQPLPDCVPPNAQSKSTQRVHEVKSRWSSA